MTSMLEDVLYEFLQEEFNTALYSELIEIEKRDLGIACVCEECDRHATQVATERVDNHILEILERTDHGPQARNRKRIESAFES